MRQMWVISMSITGKSFTKYHIQFTKQAAAYLEKGIKVDWSRRHKYLFQLLIGG